MRHEQRTVNELTVNDIVVEDNIIVITDKAEPGTGAKTLTAAMLLGGLVDEDPGGAATWTTDTATNIVAAIPNAKIGSTFQTIIKNSATAGSTEAVTLAGGVGVTTHGVALTVTEGTNETALLIFRVTGVGTPAVDCYVLTNA